MSRKDTENGNVVCIPQTIAPVCLDHSEQEGKRYRKLSMKRSCRLWKAMANTSGLILDIMRSP